MTSAMPVQCSNQLSHEVTQLTAGQFVGLMFSRERDVVWKKCYMKCGVWNQMKIWSSHLLDNLSNCLMNLKMGSNPIESPEFRWLNGNSILNFCSHVRINYKKTDNSIPGSILEKQNLQSYEVYRICIILNKRCSVVKWSETRNRVVIKSVTVVVFLFGASSTRPLINLWLPRDFPVEPCKALALLLAGSRS